jgi:hypothetical protein
MMKLTMRLYKTRNLAAALVTAFLLNYHGYDVSSKQHSQSYLESILGICWLQW